MACTYTLTLNGRDMKFDSEEALRTYIDQNPDEFGLADQYDIPDTFEGQRDQFMDRWKLSPTTRQGQFGYVSKNAKTASRELAQRMARQLQDKSSPLYDKLSIKYDATYGLIHISPRVDTRFDNSPMYDISDQGPDQSSRKFKELPDHFPMKSTDVSRYFLSPANFRTDTYAKQGEYFNVTKQRTGDAKALARNLGVAPDVLRQMVKGSKLGEQYLKDFMEGKNTVKLTLYKVDRVDDPEQFINPAEDQTLGTLRRAKIHQEKQINQRLTQEKDPHRRTELLKERNQIRTQIRELNKPENQNLAYLKQLFQDDKEAYAGKTFSDIRDINREASMFAGYAVLFKNVDLKGFGKDIEDEFKQALADIDTLLHDIERMKNELSVKQMELKTGAILANVDGEILPVKDINALASWTLALSSTQNNPLLRYIGRVTNFAVNRAKDNELQLKEKVRDAIKELNKWGKTQGLKGHHLYEYMLEEDQDGKPNGHFVVQYGDFFTNLSRTLRGKNDKESITNFLKYLRNNTQSIEILTDKFQEEYQRIYAGAVERIRERDPHLTDSEINALATTEAGRIAHHIDPENFVKILDRAQKGIQIDDKDIAFMKAFIDRGGYYKFTKVHPKEEFQDKKYAAIAALPDTDPRKVFYKLFSEFHYEVNDRMRVDEMATLRRNFIAEYKRDYKEDDESFFDYLKDSVHDWALHMTTESPRDNIQGLDPITKEIERAIPFYAFDGRIPAENKNYNLGKVLGVLAQQYYRYEALSDSENDLLTAQHVLRNTPVYETNSFGTPIMIDGEPVIKKDTASMYKQADYHILSILYNERQKKDAVGMNKHYDADTARRIKEFDDQVKNGVPLTAEQEEEYRKLKANYTVQTAKKVTNSLLHWTSIKNIGFNMFGGLAEIFQGTTSLYLRYGTKNWFNTVFPSLLKLVNIGDEAARNKFTNLRKLFHIESDVNPNVEDSLFKKVAYGPYSIARTMANSAYLISVLKDQVIKDKDGNEHNLYDVMDFDEHGKVVLPAGFDNPFYNADGSYTEYKYKLGQIVAREIKQNRDRESDVDPIQLDKHFWGRLLGQFKASWLFEGFQTRLGLEKEGLNDLDRPTKGIYRSFMDLSKVYTHKTNALGETETRFSLPLSLLKAMTNIVRFSAIGRATKWGKQGDIRELDYQGAVRTVREIQMALFLYGMVALVSGMAGGDDKDKWRKRGMIYLANFFMRTQRDMSTYFDPDSLTSIVNKNVVPALGTVNEIVKVIEDPFRGMFGGNWYYNQGKESESLRITRDMADLIPLMNQVRATINKAEKRQTIFY